MQVVAQILFKILVSLATEKVFRSLIATGLEEITKHTDSPVDDKIVEPIVKSLRGEQ